MESNLKEKKDNKSIIIVLILLLLISITFICYDKFLVKDTCNPKNCNCPVCEKNTNNEKHEEFKLCTLDMKNKTDLDVLNECIKITNENSHNVEVKNIEANDKVYNLKYIFEESEVQVDNGYSYSRNSITRIYVNDKLIDAFPGQYRNILYSLKIKDGKIVIEDTYPSETPPGEHTYNLIDVDDFEYLWNK